MRIFPRLTSSLFAHQLAIIFSNCRHSHFAAHIGALSFLIVPQWSHVIHAMSSTGSTSRLTGSN